MFKKVLIIISGIVVLIVVIFFVWHFLLSIYEVKYVHNFPGEFIQTNSKYFLSCTGINSLGWELKWRNVVPEIKILQGNKLVKILKITDNSYEILTGNEIGNLAFEISSPLALSSSKFILKIISR